jgi:uncharacterized protein (TIGR02217 family)
MAYHDVRFPDAIAQGAQIIPAFSTAVAVSSGGREQRQGNWALPRRRYNVGTGLQRRADAATLLAFFMARQGRLHSFRFKDWSDYALPRQTIGTTNGSLATFQVFKTYVSGPTTATRALTRLISGTVRCWVNNVEVFIGAGGSQFQVNLAAGIITIGATLAATSGQAVEAACEFDVHARFDSDEIALTQRSFEIGEWPDVPVIEVRE